MNNLKIIPFEKNNNAEEYIKEVKGIMSAIESNHIMLGHKLIFASEHYQNILSTKTMQPFKNIYEFAEEHFKLKKTSTATYIAVAKRFASEGMILEKYKLYNFTQLVEMLPLTDEQLKLCSTNMTVQEIRALRKALTVQSTEQTEEKNIVENQIRQTSQIIKLKNDTDRREFLENYRTWAKIGSVEAIDLSVYQCEIDNNDTIYAFSVPSLHMQYEVKYYIRTVDNKNINFSNTQYFSLEDKSVNTLIEYFRTYKCNPILN